MNSSRMTLAKIRSSAVTPSNTGASPMRFFAQKTSKSPLKNPMVFPPQTSKATTKIEGGLFLVPAQSKQQKTF